MIIETERLIIRDLEKQDIKDLYELQNDPNVTKYLSYDSWSYERCRDNINEWRDFYKKKLGPKVYVIEHKETSEMVGIVGLIYYENEDEVEIAVRIKSDKWRKGYGNEAVRTMIEIAFEDEKIERVIGITHPENLKMQGLFKKLGFIDITGEDIENGAKYLLKKNIR